MNEDETLIVSRFVVQIHCNIPAYFTYVLAAIFEFIYLFRIYYVSIIEV